ncbi:MAG: ATP-grasp domain-containing protein [Jatrophihabitantaceae bacterium]
MKNVLLIGASPAGVSALTGLGIRVAVVAGREAVPAAVVQAADLITAADLSDPYAVLAAAEAMIVNPCQLAGVLSFSELGQGPAAMLAKRWRVLGPDPEAVRLTRDKALMRQSLEGSPLEWPWRCGRPTELAAQLRCPSVVWPWIVKPIAGTGSTAVHTLRGPADLDHWERTASAAESYIAERLAGGTEYSVEAVSRDGVVDILGITEKITSGMPSHIELGHLAPALIDEQTRVAIHRTLAVLMRRLGIHNGASHTELRLDPAHGPVVVETHTRPGGDEIPALTRLTTGRDQYAEAIAAQLGLPIPPPTVVSAEAAAICFADPGEQNCHLVRLSVPAVMTDPSVQIRQLLTIGDWTAGRTPSERRPVSVRCTASSREGALAEARRTLAGIEVGWA